MAKSSKKSLNKSVSSDPSQYEKFDKFLDDSTHQLKTLTSGQIVMGTVVDNRGDSLVIDVGYKSEGIVAGREMKSDQMDVSTLKPGDELLVYVVRPEDEEGRLVLSVRRTQKAGVWIDLEKAKLENDIVEATVVESNNGGVIVEISGDIRGFIPTSQLDAKRVFSSGQRQVGKDISAGVQHKLSSLIGEKIKTRIIELDKEKNRIILSEKMVTQARDLEEREKTLRSVNEGAELVGEVSGITPYGIFVNAQGLEGLVHLSELSWDKVDNINDIYKVGDKVQVMVIGISDGGKRVAYSVKRLQRDPWSAVIAKYKVGDVVEGKVQKVVDFGAFVRIDEGLNGLVHISEMSDKLVKDPRDIVNEGDDVKVKILSISSTERHLGLSLKWDSKTPSSKSKIVSDDANTVTETTAADIAEQVEEVLSAEENTESK